MMNYRQLARDYHQQETVEKGLPPEFLEFTNNRLRDTHEAFEKVKEEHGFKHRMFEKDFDHHLMRRL